MPCACCAPCGMELLNEIPLKDTVNGSIGKRTNPFTKPQYLLLNLAIGGINGGPIDESALPMKYVSFKGTSCFFKDGY